MNKTTQMFHYKRSNGGIRYVGIDHANKEYSLDYYANVGLFSASQSTRVSSYETIKKLVETCKALNYKEVQYLKENR